jgi:hypothetical protein
MQARDQGYTGVRQQNMCMTVHAALIRGQHVLNENTYAHGSVEQGSCTKSTMSVYIYAFIHTWV